MKFAQIVLPFSIAGLVITTSGCFLKKEAPPVVTPAPVTTVKKVAAVSPKEKSLSSVARLFEQADAIHREAWWVLSSERRPIGKSPFGKVQRALLASTNVKLSNKSLFRCDRYVVNRDVMGVNGYPQKAEIFEKCSDKVAAKRLASFNAPKEGQISVSFYPDGLEEVLGLSATILNKTITCSLQGNDQDQLVKLSCKDWSQERSRDHMIRLDVYDYEKNGQNMIKLRGKVYENLTDIRKIVADVPMTGKIEVTETELYAPTPTPTVAPKAPAAPIAPVQGQQQAGGARQQGELPPGTPVGKFPTKPLQTGIPVEAIRADGSVDPDVLQQRQAPVSIMAPPKEGGPAASEGEVPVSMDPVQQAAPTTNPADAGWGSQEEMDAAAAEA
ncbi:MAG: hypothetical protein J7501_02680, partial [Bdellovibrio sp.]|nr:hypothetical protein [Bdellovibrio sp.]